MKKPVNIIDRFGNCHWPFADTYGNFYGTKRGYISTENLFQVPQKQGLVNPITDLRFHLETGVQFTTRVFRDVLQKLEPQ